MNIKDLNKTMNEFLMKEDFSLVDNTYYVLNPLKQSC